MCKLQVAGGRDEIKVVACPLSDIASHGAVFNKTHTFPARAGLFARVHGRPDGVPGGILGARAKSLRRTERRRPCVDKKTHIR